MQFADIIVDISCDALDRTYQYIVPENLQEQAVAGAQVEIPFGNGNRTLKGFILTVSTQPKIPISRMKEIKSVSDGVVIESKLIALAEWISQTYGSTMNEALKTVLPVKRKITQVEEVRLSLNLTGEEAEEELASCQKKNKKAQERLLRALMTSGGSMLMTTARKKYQITKAVVDKLAERNVITVDRNIQYRNPVDANIPLKEQPQLNDEQECVVRDFCLEYNEGIRKTYLLHGITGSGKTRVYIDLMKEVVAKGKQVIFLIPEIALTKQTVDWCVQCFGDRVSIMNSRMSEGEKYDQYMRAKQGKIDLMIGPRSALFTPFANLGLIIVDEEHESSYKSETTPKYHAREVAEYRASKEQASVVLGSATPSLEAYYACEMGKYKKYVLTKRAGEGTLPLVGVIDLREEFKAKNHSIFSRKLREEMEQRLMNHEQIMLFLNRRGYAGFVSCRNCGHVLKCSHCDVSYTSHARGRKVDTLVCHYCGTTEHMPNVCPECGSPYIASFGLGTQRIEEMVRQEFPQARVLRMDADTTSGKDGHEQVLSQFRQHEADILIGTQMIVKGHDFHDVTLMGILAADSSLFAGDYRAGERTFQLLMQAAGRPGRGEKPGMVIIQTYDPEHYAITAVKNQDYKYFYENEMAYRKIMHYPPVYAILAVLVTSVDEECARRCCEQLGEATKKHFAVIGPTAAGVAKTKDRYRFVFYVKAKTIEELKPLIEALDRYVKAKELNKQCLISYDINPLSNY